MQNKILKAKIYSCFLIFFSLVITILGIILAGSVSDSEVKIYGLFYIIAGIISSILMSQVLYRLKTMSMQNAEINNQACFTNWKVLFGSILNNRDFFFQKYLLSCFIILLFHSTVSFLTRLRFNNTSFEFSSNVPISVILFIISFIFGLLFQLYLVVQIIQMIADYKEQQKSIIFIIHLKESFEEEKNFKKSITLFSAVFMILSSIYYLTKIGLYAAIANQTDDTNTKVYSAIMIIQSLFLVFVCTKIFNILERIYRQIPDQQSVVIYNMNIQCFSGWYTLITSLLLSRKLSFWRNLIFILQFIQTLYGLIKFPFYNIYTVTIYQMYSLESYLYFDSALMLALMGWQFIDTFARVIHSVKKRNITYQFEDHRNNVVIPDGVQVSLEQIVRINYNENQLDNFVENADKEFGDCCICLDRISKGQRIYRLKCHMSHVFHYYCMSKWITNHNTCPLCQQTITT